MHALKQVFHYIASTKEYKLVFNSKTQTSSLIGYVDADWASDGNMHRSISGYVFLLGSTPVSWAAKKRQSVSLSSTESEYMASSLTTREAVYLQQFLIELGFHQISATTLS